MKKACIRFLLVAAAVLTLSGCGEKAGTGTAGKYPQPETHYTSPTDPTDSSRTRSRRPGESGTIVGRSRAAGRSAAGRSSPEARRSWQQMVENGTVRDTDGDLRDGENSSW